MLKISYRALYARVFNKKWDIARALSEPLRPITTDLVKYNQKIYRSVAHLCYTLNIDCGCFRKLLGDGLSIEEAVDRLLSDVSIRKKFHYKEKEYTIVELYNHPDNTHKISKNTIRNRLSVENPNIEALFAPLRHQSCNYKSFTYRGEEYPSKLDFIRKHNLREIDYKSFCKFDIKSENLEGYLDELLAKSKNK